MMKLEKIQGVEYAVKDDNGNDVVFESFVAAPQLPTVQELAAMLREAYMAMADTNRRMGCTAFPMQYAAMEKMKPLIVQFYDHQEIVRELAELARGDKKNKRSA